MTATNHPWCSNTARDEAIRAAEDAAAAERTQLPDHRDLPAAVADLRRRVEGLETVADHWRRQCEADADAEKREDAVVSREGVTFTENGVFREAKTPSGSVNPAADVSCGEADGLRDVRDSRTATAIFHIDTTDTIDERGWHERHDTKNPMAHPVPGAAGDPEQSVSDRASADGVAQARAGDRGAAVSGLRTERVTLEVTQQKENYVPAREWSWREYLSYATYFLPGESVRVVDEPVEVAYGQASIARLTAERDAALRDLATAMEHCKKIEARLTKLEGERDAARRERDEATEECYRLRATVAGLERRYLRCVDLRDADGDTIATLKARVAELERDRRPATWQEEEAAVEGAWLLCGLEPDWPSDEPGTIVRHAESMRREIARLRARVAELEQQIKLDDRWSAAAPAANAGGEQPQPPRGWLTEEEREAVQNARSYYHAQTCGMNEDGGWYKLHKRRQLACEALLARSTPPKVRRPRGDSDLRTVRRDNDWIAAIREAGGEVGE